jgi:hypothetical protein
MKKMEKVTLMREKGWTLIEAMIVCAMMAIVFSGISFGLKAYERFLHFEDWQTGCLLAKKILVHPASANTYPPQVFVVPYSLQIYLAHIPISGTLRIYANGKIVSSKDYMWNFGTNQIRFASVFGGKTVVVNYDFSLPWEEIKTVPFYKNKAISLENKPVFKIVSVFEALGNKLVPLPPSRYLVNMKKNSIMFPSLPEKVVLISYYGGSMEFRICGEFASQNLKPQGITPGPWKKIILTLQNHFDGGRLQFFTFVKT